ncbi:MAG: ABC transporter ATP-binding protein [Candidatus Atribacteria bacterium]|nr:MAG: ABC transporter ATP-binding protein [Candidatus Atribacteria bacterium]
MPVIRVDDLGKRYRLGQMQPYKTLRESLGRAISFPIRAALGTRDDLEERHQSREILWALRHVSLEVNQGEVVGIIGKNGSGKSTLLKILAQITWPTEGRVEFKGHVGAMLEVGTGFHPELTGRENVYLNGAILGMRKAEITRRFDEIVEFSGVERFLDTPVKRYSTGMYVRLAFSVAAHLEPDVLLIDEVLSVGDVDFQKKCLAMIKGFPESGRTVLFVSHNLWSVRQLCDRIVLLEDGRIISRGPADEVVAKYVGEGSGGIEESGTLDPFAVSVVGKGVGGYEIMAVRITDRDGNLANRFGISQGALAEITMNVKTAGVRPQFSLALFDDHRHRVFGSLNNTDPAYGEALEPGEYIVTCEIPADLLNNGLYSISLICGTLDGRDSQRLETVTKFECIDDGILRGDYKGEYTGALRPRLEWQTRKAGTS